jgi:AcrR family transcriptional regulator
MMRGRPREFDADIALDRVLPVFWRDGFEGASVQELADAAGVSKPSLYAAYGNKEALYLAALKRYADEHTADRVARLEAEPDAREAMRQFMRATVDTYTDRSHPSGCLVVTGTTTSDSAAVPEAVRNALCASMRAAASVLEARLARAQREGQLSHAVDPAALASYFNTVMAGLSVQAKAGAERDALLRVVDEAMRGWPAA